MSGRSSCGAIRHAAPLLLLLAARLHPQTPKRAEPAHRLPRWLEISGEFRGRVEGSTGLGFAPGQQDFYYLHRIRPTLVLRPLPNLRIQLTPQHTEVAGYRPPVPGSVADRADIHQAFGEWSKVRGTGWGIRAGRQEIRFGLEHLLGAANWGNVSRSFDAVRVYHESSVARIDTFASTLVSVEPRKFNRFTTTTQIHGVHAAWKKLPGGATAETYVFLKANPRESSEAGRTGRTRHATAGLRIMSPLPHRFDLITESNLQFGTLGGEPHRAAAGTYTLGYRVAAEPNSSRLFAIYSFASGDRNRGDGRSDTFDQLYPTNHGHFGIADRIAWRNLHEAEGGFLWRARKNLSARFEYHSFWLATKRDAYYDFRGRQSVRNPRAASAHVSQEVDVHAIWDATKEIQMVFGYSHIFPGAFLKETTSGGPVTAPYVQWRYLF